ncbi:MAG TPA: 2,3,4,5-tetrahydropyridine-2,6-dicarboxylate N-succinyltransferase [Steroidobacteraceae bacterium]|nr:2,3,4,5-tetrahydropyridine-2,6-dicarboxylate N-succinyltransferase [Steroidobacteraceae bacterium]
MSTSTPSAGPAAAASPPATSSTASLSALQPLIEAAFERRQSLSSSSVDAETRAAVEAVIGALDRGEARVAERETGRWRVNEWLKKAVLLYFRTHDNAVVQAGYTRFYDKVPLKYTDAGAAQFAADGVRVVPHAIVRHGAYVGPNAVLMPCYVNIGAYVGAGTMVDTWVTVGSCAQIGRNVHLSGGVGIGGVLEPLQAAPTIIEDDCFIGARSEIAEGVIVGEGSVIAMGTFLSASTRIYDRASGVTLHGQVPPGSVVVPGAMPSTDRSHSLYCAVIVKRVDAKTRAKTSINELLREAGASA